MNRVTKPTAQALKEAGFDVKVSGQYFNGSDGWTLIECHPKRNYNAITSDRYISAPTQDEAANWLREKGMHLCIRP